MANYLQEQKKSYNFAAEISKNNKR
jgi:hypothetical protein